MNRSYKYVLVVALCVLFTQSQLLSQKLIQSGSFKYIPLHEGKAALIKEIPLSNISQAAHGRNFNMLKKWVKNNFTADPLNTSIIYDDAEESVVIKSKVELLLPILNEHNVSQKAMMHYSIRSFILNDKCVFEVSDIRYKLQNVSNMKKKIRAEDFVTNEALIAQDKYYSQKVETQKGTLYYFNNLTGDLTHLLNP